MVINRATTPMDLHHFTAMSHTVTTKIPVAIDRTDTNDFDSFIMKHVKSDQSIALTGFLQRPVTALCVAMALCKRFIFLSITLSISL